MNNVKKLIYLSIVFAVAACMQPCSNKRTGNIVPRIPDDITDIPLAVNVEVDSFPHKIDVEYIGDSVAISKLPEGVEVTVEGADVLMRSTSGGVEYSISGMSDNGSFALVTTHSPLVTLSSLKLFSHKKNTISLSSQGTVFLRSSGSSLNYLMDGLPKDTLYAPKNSASLFIDADAVISSGNMALRGERNDAVYCTGKLILNNVNIAVEAARADALSADSGLLVLSGNLNIKASEDALKSKSGYVSVYNGIVELKCSGDKGDAIQAGDVYVYGGNIIANVSGAAARGINSKASVYLLGGMLDITSCGNAMLPQEKNDYISGACIKTERHLYINEAFVRLKNTGDGGKCISCNGLMQVDGGSLFVENHGNDLLHHENINAHVSAKGIKCDSCMLVRGGVLEVLVYGKGKDCKGVETECGMTVEGENTTVYVYAYDNAFNNGGSFVMNAGRVYAYSVANDAVDTSDGFLLNGGILIANGCGEPEQGIDAGGCSCFTIKGGTLVAIGGTMSMNVNTQQPAVAWSGIELMRDKYISVADEKDNLLCAYRIPRILDRGVFTYSSDKIKADKTYSLTISDSLVASRCLGNGFYVEGKVTVACDSVTWKQNKLIMVLSKTGDAVVGGY